MTRKQFEWQSDDGLTLFSQSWQPDANDTNAVVCLVHGIGEHSGRYEDLVRVFNEAGIAVLAFDLRGHGRSEGQRGHSISYEALMDDIAHMVAEAERLFPHLPTFLYGHSLGGNLTLNFVLRRQPQLSGAIVTGPMLRTTYPVPWWRMLMGRILYAIWPSFTLPNGLSSEDLSRDAEAAEEYEEDPLVHDRMSAQLGIDAYESGLWALQHAGQLSLPLLLMHGAEDRITSAEASREFAANAGDLCTLVIWPDMLHEIHKESEKEQVFDCSLKWIEDHR
jgi:alpha-beta hydrolase superfamily lysophospholipase